MGVGRRPVRLHSVASLSFLVARRRDFTGVLARRLLYAGRCCVVCQRVKQPAAAVIEKFIPSRLEEEDKKIKPSIMRDDG